MPSLCNVKCRDSSGANLVLGKQIRSVAHFTPLWRVRCLIQVCTGLVRSDIYVLNEVSSKKWFLDPNMANDTLIFKYQLFDGLLHSFLVPSESCESYILSEQTLAEGHRQRCFKMRNCSLMSQKLSQIQSMVFENSLNFLFLLIVFRLGGIFKIQYFRYQTIYVKHT